MRQGQLFSWHAKDIHVGLLPLLFVLFHGKSNFALPMKDVCASYTVHEHISSSDKDVVLTSNIYTANTVH